MNMSAVVVYTGSICEMNTEVTGWPMEDQKTILSEQTEISYRVEHELNLNEIRSVVLQTENMSKYCKTVKI